MARKTDTPCFSHLILRGAELSIENTPKTKILRTQYLSRTCYLNPNLPSDIKVKLHGLRVAVVGDFMHTGATLNVVAQILKENGVHWVSNWVILRTRQVEKM
jgi:predicted amidophosphoribosyltransferase